MALKFLLDILTGNMALVDVPSASTPVQIPQPAVGTVIGPGFFMFLTYANEQ